MILKIKKAINKFENAQIDTLLEQISKIEIADNFTQIILEDCLSELICYENSLKIKVFELIKNSPNLMIGVFKRLQSDLQVELVTQILTKDFLNMINLAQHDLEDEVHFVLTAWFV